MSDYPKDWEEVKLSNILIPQPFHDYLCKKTSNIGKYPIIQQGDEPIYGYAESKPYEEYKRVLLFGDHTLSLYRPTKPFLLSSDGVKILKCSDEFNRDYVFYLMKNYMPESEGYKRHYTVIKNLELMITQKKQEQKAIADTLMTLDKHVENLEMLIEKKKMIRDGAVEDLMTGKTRLDGFDGEWEEKKIGELCYIVTKQTGFDYTNYIKDSLKKSKSDHDISFIQNKDFSLRQINMDTDYYIPLDVAEQFPKILLEEKCLLISISGRVGNVGVYEKNKKAFLGGAICVLKFSNKKYIDWIMYYLSSKKGSEILIKNEKKAHIKT